jgi:hypoxanthine phosphoribosyltransferase
MVDYEKDIQSVLLSEETIRRREEELGKILTEDYADKNPVIVGVLKGVVVFYADMIRQIRVPCQMDFMWLSSYAGTNSTGEMIVRKDISTDIRGRHVLILEDIFDTGTSLDFTCRHLLEKEPASLKICTLLDKPSRRKPNITLKPDYVGFTIPNEFVVGYGLDFNEHLRNLPYIGIMKPEAYL